MVVVLKKKSLEKSCDRFRELYVIGLTVVQRITDPDKVDTAVRVCLGISTPKPLQCGTINIDVYGSNLLSKIYMRSFVVKVDQGNKLPLVTLAS